MKTYNQLAVDLLLAGDQAGLTRLAARAKDSLEGRCECPECGDFGPHDDNGCSGSELCYCCRNCGTHFEPEGAGV